MQGFDINYIEQKIKYWRSMRDAYFKLEEQRKTHSNKQNELLRREDQKRFQNDVRQISVLKLQNGKKTNSVKSNKNSVCGLDAIQQIYI